MRILLIAHHHIVENAGVGGTTIALRDAMRAAGHEVEIFGFGEAWGGAAPRAARLRFPWRVDALLRRTGTQFDVIDATTGDAWVWLSRPRDGLTVVTRAHGLEHVAHRALMEHVRRGEAQASWRYRMYSGGYRLWEVKRSVQRADGVILLNAADAAFTMDQWQVPASHILVAENAASNALRSLSPPHAASSRAQPVALAFIGSWIQRKGIALVTGTADALVARGVPFTLDILGSGLSSERVLADFSPRARDSVRVRATYAPEELPALLARTQILLHTSWTEGYSVALVEGMACGLAPIATDCGGAMQLLRDGTAGLLPSPATPATFADAIGVLNADRERLHQLRCAAHAAAIATSWADVAARTVAFYRSVRRG